MQTPVAISASVLAIVLWLLSRRRLQWSAQPPARPAASGAPALVVSANRPGAAAGAEPVGAGLRPGPGRLQQNRRQWLLGLSAQLQASPEQRLLALVQLSGRSDRSVLPLLRRALRDPHLKVMGAAAAAMEPYRGGPATSRRGAAAAGRRRLPRNAAPRV